MQKKKASQSATTALGPLLILGLYTSLWVTKPKTLLPSIITTLQQTFHWI